MAEAQGKLKQSGLTRGKAVVIAVLAIVLVVILYVQFGSSSEKAGSASVGYRPQRPPVASKSAALAAKPGATTDSKTPVGNATGAALIIDETRWKSPELAAVIAYDPFALPAAFPQPPRVAVGTKSAGAEGLIAAAAEDDAKKLAEALGKLRMQLDELQQRGVHVIVRERDQYVAWIGERMLHVGDDINGFTVTAIDPSGVHVERKESP